MAFRFKQFIIKDEKSSMKVGTDAVLLGAWVDLSDITSILEIGTGCGIITLMLAQRCKASITAIDIDKDSCTEAIANVNDAHLSEKINIKNLSLRDYTSSSQNKYDLIISNPPYFINSLKPAKPNFIYAKHNELLSYHELIINSKKLLRGNGRIYLIIPYQNKDVLMNIVRSEKLYCTHELKVIPKTGKPPNRVILCIEYQNKRKIPEELTITDLHNNYTDHYKSLTKDFYLNF